MPLIEFEMSTYPYTEILTRFNKSDRVGPTRLSVKYPRNDVFGTSVFMFYNYLSGTFPDKTLPDLKIRRERGIPFLYLASVHTTTDHLLMQLLLKNETNRIVS